MIGIGQQPVDDDSFDPDITNAGGQPVTTVPEVCYFDSCMSFAIIRGGHVDSTVLGALEVDSEGNLANWIHSRQNGSGHGWSHGSGHWRAQGDCCHGALQ